MQVRLHSVVQPEELASYPLAQTCAGKLSVLLYGLDSVRLGVMSHSSILCWNTLAFTASYSRHVQGVLDPDRWLENIAILKAKTTMTGCFIPCLVDARLIIALLDQQIRTANGHLCLDLADRLTF